MTIKKSLTSVLTEALILGMVILLLSACTKNTNNSIKKIELGNKMVIVDFENQKIIDVEKLSEDVKIKLFTEPLDKSKLEGDIWIEVSDPEIEAIGNSKVHFLSEEVLNINDIDNTKNIDFASIKLDDVKKIDFSKWDSSGGKIYKGAVFIVKKDETKFFKVKISDFQEKEIESENGKKAADNSMKLEYQLIK